MADSKNTKKNDDKAQEPTSVGRDAADKNTDAEKSENRNEPGADSTQHKVMTSDAQPELKAEGDKKTHKSTVLGSSEKAQEPDYGVKEGQAEAAKNHKADVENTDVSEDGTTDPVAAGRATAKKNFAAEQKLANSGKKTDNDAKANKGDK